MLLPPLALAFIVAIWAVVVVTQTDNYRADGLYYTDMALRFAGTPVEEAADLTRQWYATLGTAVPSSYLDPSLNHDWLLVEPRFVYPLLSAPFVRLLGIPGMLVVPALSLLITSVAVGLAAVRSSGQTAAFSVVMLLLASTFIAGWSTDDITDGVAMGEAAIILAILVINPRPLGARMLICLGLLVGLLCFTRQTGPIAIGIVLVPWLWEVARTRSVRNAWSRIFVVTTAVATACTAFTLVRWPFPLAEEMTRATRHASLEQALVNYPGTIARMIVSDLNAVATRDHPLLVLVGLAIVGMVLAWRSEAAAMAIGATLAAIAVAGLNGAALTDFRYLMPAVPYLALAAAVGLRRLTLTCSPRLSEANR